MAKMTPLSQPQYGRLVLEITQRGYEMLPETEEKYGSGVLVMKHKAPNGWDREHRILVFPNGEIFHDSDSFRERDTAADSLKWLRDALIELFDLHPDCDSQNVYDYLARLKEGIPLANLAAARSRKDSTEDQLKDAARSR